MEKLKERLRIARWCNLGQKNGPPNYERVVFFADKSDIE